MCNTVYMYVDTASYAYVQPRPHNRPIPFYLAFQCFMKTINKTGKGPVGMRLLTFMHVHMYIAISSGHLQCTCTVYECTCV